MVNGPDRSGLMRCKSLHIACAIVNCMAAHTHRNSTSKLTLHNNAKWVLFKIFSHEVFQNHFRLKAHLPCSDHYNYPCLLNCHMQFSEVIPLCHQCIPTIDTNGWSSIIYCIPSNKIHPLCKKLNTITNNACLHGTQYLPKSSSNLFRRPFTNKLNEICNFLCS